MTRAMFSFLLLIGLAACGATGHISHLNDVNIIGRKIIALDAPAVSWGGEIQTRLEKKGFRVVRWKNGKQVTNANFDSGHEPHNNSPVRYVLVVTGYAPL